MTSLYFNFEIAFFLFALFNLFQLKTNKGERFNSKYETKSANIELKYVELAK